MYDLRVKHPSHQKIAIFTRYKGGVRRPGRMEGNIDIVLGAGCWFWIIPLRDDVLSIGCVANIADWKATGLSPEAYFDKAVQSSPYVLSRVKPGTRSSDFYTASNFSYSSKRFAGDGFLLAGDAAEFLDPIFSTGVILAMRSGERAGRDLAEAIRAGGPLHDIGKLEVDRAILDKPGALDPVELEEIRSHPELGARMLRGIRSLRAALDCVLHHHERWDGTGYPNGLADAAIPLEARIFAVCDAIEAMTTARPYREALPTTTALYRVREASGQQFDPAVVEALGSIPRSP
jgi:flavin-dependent dehydrogenase